MFRHKSDIYIQKLDLYTSALNILSESNDADRVVGIIRKVTDDSSTDKINGLTPFPLTGMLFASNEENFLVLDKPVI